MSIPDGDGIWLRIGRPGQSAQRQKGCPAGSGNTGKDVPGLVPGRAEIEHRRLGGVEVVDDYVDMHLLGHLLSRSSRRSIGLYLLE